MALLQACLNGGRRKAEHPAIPETPAELACDAAAVRAAGAGALHLHPRRPDGTESLAPEAVAAALTAVRQAVPGMPVGISTGDWIAPGGRPRHADIQAWRERPDYVSVNLNEPDGPEVIAMILARGIDVEAGIATPDDARRFVALDPAPACLRILVEMPDEAPAAARAIAASVLTVLAEAGVTIPLLLHGQGGSVWEMVRMAAERGLDTRVGFEDGLTLPDGTSAAMNAALVAAAADRLA